MSDTEEPAWVRRPIVTVGDRFKFSIDAFNFINGQPDHSTVMVRCAEIRYEDDGSKTIIVTPE